MGFKDKARMTIFVEDWVKTEFARLAEVRRRSPSNEAELLLETEIKEAYSSGELNRPEQLEDAEDVEAIVLAAQSKDRLIQSLLAGHDQTKNGDLIIAADSLGVDRKTLEALVQRLCNGDSKKNASSKQ